jgi:hypothetical protein
MESAQENASLLPWHVVCHTVSHLVGGFVGESQSENTEIFVLTGIEDVRNTTGKNPSLPRTGARQD